MELLAAAVLGFTLVIGFATAAAIAAMRETGSDPDMLDVIDLRHHRVRSAPPSRRRDAA